MRRGSSPRVRGAPRLGRGCLQRPRFIPACAGSAHTGHRHQGRPPVHPRVCGERLIVPVSSWRASGSSPRVRGAHARSSWIERWLRFIPACAGSASIIISSSVFQSVHPRVCGERLPRGREEGLWTGSSPRVRGALTPQEVRKRSHRFIPACAGSASDRGRLLDHLPVHPRVCGERETFFGAHCKRPGSSPRVRGALEELVHFGL